MVPKKNIDVLEGSLRNRGELLNILLIDRTTKKNIKWATDSYQLKINNNFAPNKQIKPELVTGKMYGKLIQPRAAKPMYEQRKRTKDKAEVFTPLHIVDQMNKAIDWSYKYPLSNEDWQSYVKELKLEITCGEAPFIVGRYNPDAHTGKIIRLYKNTGKPNRVGFLDRKLYVVSKYCHKHSEWVKWAKEAYMASYGYEWQGDNILIARENLLYTFIDFYVDKFKHRPTLKLQEEIAEIISWNIFQMDGLKYVVPMSCKHINRIIPGDLTLFGETPDIIEKDECEGCKLRNPLKHNGKYVKIMDWENNKPIKFVSLLRNVSE